MIPRNLKAGDVILCNGSRNTLGKIIGWFEWGQSKSPEYSHVALYYDGGDGPTGLVEQFWPHPSKKPLSEYDKDFDNGAIKILRAKGPFDEAAFRAWVENNMNIPYGLDDIARFSRQGFLVRLFPSAWRWMKSKSINGHSLVCSQWAAWAIAAGLGREWWHDLGWGDNQITPGDYLCADSVFEVVC